MATTSTKTNDFATPQEFAARVKKYLQFMHPGDYSDMDTKLHDVHTLNPEISEIDVCLVVFGCPDRNGWATNARKKYPLFALILESEMSLWP